ncbi:MAG: type II toxin-antitoxin system death-on-curing family toxin [Candidatus Hydrogenedens sp.]|nr:type II toxin-antitoxin system death-on-curing family toxin [Candidatus Hydrogenedens sp.]
MIRWLSESDVLYLHEQVIRDFGGSHGVRDVGLLSSALQRPVNLNAYEEVEDLIRLAASYAFGISRNHPFIDGNKRAAFAAMFAFLRLNGIALCAEQEEATSAMLGLAAGDISEGDLTSWLALHTQQP